MFIQLPADIIKYEDISEQPVCGVIVTAIVAGTTFEQAWNYYKQSESPKWRGALAMSKITRGIRAHGVKFVNCTKLIERYRNKPFRKFLTENALVDPLSVYVVYTNRHVQVVQGHRVLDQQGVSTNAMYWANGRRIIGIYRVGSEVKVSSTPKEHKMTNKVTKYTKAKEIVSRLKAEGKSRKDILFTLTIDLETTWRSASTFYHRVTREAAKANEKETA